MARLADGHHVDDPDAYLLQAVRNAALDERRASARRRGSPPGDESLPARSPQAHLTDWPAKSPKKAPDIVDQVIERQRSEDLLTAVRQTMTASPPARRPCCRCCSQASTRAVIGQRFNLTGQRVGQLLKKPIADLLGQLEIDPPGPRQQRSAGQRS